MMIVFRNQCEIHCRLSNVCFSIRGVIFCICTISYFSFSSMLFLMITFRSLYDFVIVFAYFKEYVYLLLNAKFYRNYWCFIWYLYFFHLANSVILFLMINSPIQCNIKILYSKLFAYDFKLIFHVSLL